VSTRVVVLADTHLPRRGRQLPVEVVDALGTADLIIHLGDFTELEVATSLEGYAPLVAVHGNNDSREVRARFPDHTTITLEGHTIRLIHGHLGGRTALEAARGERGAEVVLFGHSHQPVMLTERGVLLFNPGSPVDRRWSQFKAFGILEIDENIQATIVRLPQAG
jgi:putative phosphoesterase